jgi:hypothetical protein
VKINELSAKCLFDFDLNVEDSEVVLPPLQCELRVASIVGEEPPR